MTNNQFRVFGAIAMLIGGSACAEARRMPFIESWTQLDREIEQIAPERLGSACAQLPAVQELIEAKSGDVLWSMSTQNDSLSVSLVGIEGLATIRDQRAYKAYLYLWLLHYPARADFLRRHLGPHSRRLANGRLPQDEFNEAFDSVLLAVSEDYALDYADINVANVISWAETAEFGRFRSRALVPVAQFLCYHFVEELGMLPPPRITRLLESWRAIPGQERAMFIAYTDAPENITQEEFAAALKCDYGGLLNVIMPVMIIEGRVELAESILAECEQELSADEVQRIRRAIEIARKRHARKVSETTQP